MKEGGRGGGRAGGGGKRAELVWGREAGIGKGYSPLGSSLPWREDCCREDRVLFYQSSRVDKMSAMTERQRYESICKRISKQQVICIVTV